MSRQPPAGFTAILARELIRRRVPLLALFALMTGWMLVSALDTRIDAGFNKRLPLEHEYIQTFLKYQHEFGGANRVLLALAVEEGDIFSREFFELLRKATDEAYQIPGVDRASIQSLWTPNTRFVEIVEQGFTGGNVVPADFDGSVEALEQVRDNIGKAGIVGRLVANDFSAALISVQLQEIDPATGERLDYIAVADHLESAFRDRFQEAGRAIGLRVHIIGFAKVIGDVAEGAVGVVLFFLVSLLVTGLFIYLYSQSARLTFLLLATSLVGVIWQMGMLNKLGYGIDPMSILVPFLIFAIAVSHGVQMVRAYRSHYFVWGNSQQAARVSFQTLLVPGLTALVTDTIGFVTILLIDIEIIQELAIAASVGVAMLVFTNLILLPLLLSFVPLKEEVRERMRERRRRTDRFWRPIARVSDARVSVVVIVLCGLLGVWGLFEASKVQVGDSSEGVPELRADSRYNIDTRFITSHFNIGVDIVTVIVETVPDGVIDHEVMELVDRFGWHMRNLPGVQSVASLPEIAKTINAGWNEGSLKWRVLPRHPASLAQAISPVDTSTGLLNTDGSVMPVMIFLEDHRADTIARVVTAVKRFREAHPSDKASFELATGNVGIMGATNEVVSAAQFPILLWVFTAVIVLCLVSFRSWKPAFCVVVPLALVSLLAYAVMYRLEIGLKVSTLPVVALGVGVGVDYGIYLFSRLLVQLRRGDYFEEALTETFKQTGSAVVFTGLTLAVGVSTWLFSALKFQADMGLLLTFMFLANMLGAMVLLPAIARWLFRHHRAGDA